MFELLLNGATYKEIAQHMHWSESTVKWCASKIYRKYGLDTRAGSKRSELLSKLGRFRVIWESFAVVAFLLCAIPAFSSTPTVSHAANSTAGGTAVTVAVTVIPGDLSVACAYSDVSASNVLSITDSASQTGYTPVTNTPVKIGTGVAECFYKPNSAALTSITCNYTVSGTQVCIPLDVAGAATGSPFDANATNAVTASATATSTSLATGSALSTNNANDILIYFVGENAASSGWTAGTGYSIPSGISVTSQRGSIQTKGVTASGSQGTTTISWTTTGGDRLGIHMAFADTNQSGGAALPGFDKRRKLDKLDEALLRGRLDLSQIFPFTRSLR